MVLFVQVDVLGSLGFPELLEFFVYLHRSGLSEYLGLLCFDVPELLKLSLNFEFSGFSGSLSLHRAFSINQICKFGRVFCAIELIEPIMHC